MFIFLCNDQMKPLHGKLSSNIDLPALPGFYWTTVQSQDVKNKSHFPSPILNPETAVSPSESVFFKCISSFCYLSSWTAYLKGRYSSAPLSQWLYGLGHGKVENAVHYELFCPLYMKPRIKFLSNIIAQYDDKSPHNIIVELPDFNQTSAIYMVALLAMEAKKLWHSFVKMKCSVQPKVLFANPFLLFLLTLLLVFIV